MLIAFGVGVILLYYFRRDDSIDLKKTMTIRPVIKFRMYPMVKIADKKTQTSPPYSPMSQVSMDFPYPFDENYLKSSQVLNRKCEQVIDGTNELSAILATMTECETAQ